MFAPWKKRYDQPRHHIKKQRHYFANKGWPSQSYGFSSSHVWMWGLDYKESWALKNWCFWAVMLKKTLESLLDCKEIQPAHPKVSPSWLFIGKTDVEAETPIVGLLMWRTDSFEKTLMLGKIEGRRRGGDGGWDGWMASTIQWTWGWVNSGSWWRTGRSCVLQSMGSQRDGYSWVTEVITARIFFFLKTFSGSSFLPKYIQWSWNLKFFLNINFLNINIFHVLQMKFE